MKLKRIIASVMIMAAAFSLAACGTNTSSNKVPEDDRTTIRVSMFNDASYTNWRAYVHEQCPEIKIVWENNRNSFDNLLYMAEHDDMADIVSIRKFTSDGAKSLSPYLADLKGNAMTDTFTDGSLSFFTYDDKVNWYPESGMISSLYVNKSLLDSLGIAVPATRAELEEACTKMVEQGYYGLTSDFCAGYHATATLEGFGAQYFFETEAGNAWREAYQDGTVHTSDTETFTQVGDVLTSLVQNNVITQPMWKLSGTGRETAFDNGTSAFVMKGSDVSFDRRSGIEYTAIPFLGESADDSYVYSYPCFSIGISKKSAEDQTKKAAIDHLLEVMYSEEAQNNIAEDGEYIFSYNKGIEIPYAEEFENINKLVQDGKMFVRFMDSRCFDAAVAGLDVLINKKGTTEDFIKAFDEQLSTVVEDVKVGECNVSAGEKVNENLVSPAASVTAQAVLRATGTDFVLMDKRESPTPFYKGTYTETQLNAVALNDPLYEAQLTGAEIETMFAKALELSSKYAVGSLESTVEYPAIAGFSAKLGKETKSSVIYDKDGKEIEDAATYRVVISQRIYNSFSIYDKDRVSNFKVLDGVTFLSVVRAAMEAGSLPEPMQYYTSGR